MELLFIVFILTNINYIISNDEDFECEIDKPLYDITTNSCVISSFDESKHKISNKIIKKQWQNRINQIGIEGNWYMGYDISSNGDLIIQSIRYFSGTLIKERVFYGIKSNGRELFFDEEENKFINQITINSSTIYKKFESEFIKIKLINDDKDYYLSSSISNHTIEIINLNDNEITGIFQGLLFDQEVISFRYSIFELSNPKTYMFGFIIKNDSNFYLSLQKFQFYKTDLNQEDSFNKLGYSLQNENFEVYNSKIISCIEISKYSIIQCFYLDTAKYLTVGLYQEENLNFTFSEKILDNFIDFGALTEYKGFYKCILLKKEISILSYVMKNETNNALFIQIKEIVYKSNKNEYSLEDYIVRYKEIMVSKDIVISDNDNHFYSFDIIKNNDNKFSIAFFAKSLNKIFVIIIQLYKIHDTNLYIKYYSINLNLYGYSIFLYLVI